ncbi:MAG TPA: hypothetical protein VFV58_30870 [Blastocatellia bacterium]|nr:hypothetical protein [Blastocatellia bacterium]
MKIEKPFAAATANGSRISTTNYQAPESISQPPKNLNNILASSFASQAATATAEELFDKPYPPAPPLPPAWEGDSIAVEFADRECARLLLNCLFDPPITEEEIDEHARRFGLSRRQAEIEIREARNV